MRSWGHRIRGGWPALSAGLLAAGLLGGTAPAAAAKPGWTIQRTPNPAGSVSNYFSGLSCASANACMAVGYSAKMALLGVPLSEGWDGSRWRIHKVPAPSGVDHSYLNAVSCPATRVCVAVGYADLGSQNYTLAERWNGSKWTIMRTRNTPGASQDYLNAVSCSSAKACVAVGYYSTQKAIGTSFVERWDGKHWTFARLPSPAGATHTHAYGISCISAKDCTVVGESLNGMNIETTLAERWNGKHWRIQRTANPGNAQNSYLNTVSCTAVSWCMAVGGTNPGATSSTPLAERWNGKDWAKVHPLTPPKTVTSYLGGVSCVSAKACTSVGYFSPSDQTGSAFAERWTGSGWMLQHTAKPQAATHTNLYGVACVSARDCRAVGEFSKSATGEMTLAERWQAR